MTAPLNSEFALFSAAADAIRTDTSPASACCNTRVKSPNFTALVLDGLPRLLKASYVLRYQVYCLERGFLPPDRYPDWIETDEFDEHAIHLGVINARGELAATARLVRLTVAGLPCFDHCTFYGGVHVLRDPGRKVIEISRLAVSRKYSRRASDGRYGMEPASRRGSSPEHRRSGEMLMTLYKAVYQVSKRRGITDWVAAKERSLHRLITHSGFPFRPIGPQTDYYGPVSPYLLHLPELDEVIASGKFPLLNDFAEGLGPQFQPQVLAR